MAFFDDFKKQMSGVAQSAQKVAEIARIQHLVNVKQNEFTALFAEIGELYYACQKRGEQPGENMTERCARVDALAAEIETLKLKLDELKQIRRCTQCGSVQNNNSRFCASCGAKLEERVVREEKPAEAEAAADDDDFKNAVREEVEKELNAEANAEANKEVYINWPETEKTDDEPAAADKE